MSAYPVWGTIAYWTYKHKGEERVQLVWVPGPAGIEANEETDSAANDGRAMGETGSAPPAAIELRSAKADLDCSRGWNTVHSGYRDLNE